MNVFIHGIKQKRDQDIWASIAVIAEMVSGDNVCSNHGYRILSRDGEECLMCLAKDVVGSLYMGENDIMTILEQVDLSDDTPLVVTRALMRARYQRLALIAHDEYMNGPYWDHYQEEEEVMGG
jgi:hypothetical protein